MEEQLWTSSFWRLLSNCSDSRKLLILQKIILHKLGNSSDYRSLFLKSKGNDKQIANAKPVAWVNKHNRSLHNNEMSLNSITTKPRVAPVMGTNALLAKYKDCEESDESKIIANLVNTKFNKKYNPVHPAKYDLDQLNISELIMDDSPLTFDEKKFLEDALGDEMNSFNSTEFECPEYEDEISLPEAERSISISSSRISSLISRATSVCSSLQRRICKSKNSPTKVSKCSIYLPVINTEADLLLQEASIQHQVIIEACKALNVCLSSREFTFGPEHIAAERILLLAMCKQNMVLKAMKQLKNMKEASNITNGFAEISHLQFPLSSKIQKEGYINWFVVIITCGKGVFATNSVVVDTDNSVKFKEAFKFQDLQHDFEIEICIYSLLAKGCVSYLQHEETVTCLKTPDRIRCRRNSIRRSKQHCIERRETSFKLWGRATLNIRDSETSAPYQLEQIPSGTTLKGVVLLDFKSTVQFEEKHAGFLTLRTECGHSSSWNHRWCKLKGHTICYWNYPADQDTVEPIGKINLQQCVTSEISIADRNLCARPRTLLIETAEPSDQGTVFFRHFLSADSTEKMIFWKECLNEVLSELLKWNMMKCKIQLT